MRQTSLVLAAGVHLLLLLLLGIMVLTRPHDTGRPPSLILAQEMAEPEARIPPPKTLDNRVRPPEPPAGQMQDLLEGEDAAISWTSLYALILQVYYRYQ